MITMKEIQDVAERIGRDFRPRKVILFGSYAYGTPTPDSDVDLLVIMPFRGMEVYKSVEIARKANPPFPMDLLVRTPAEVRKRLGWNDSFIRRIIEKGKVLYEADDGGVGSQSRGRLRRRGTRISRPKEPDV